FVFCPLKERVAASKRSPTKHPRERFTFQRCVELGVADLFHPCDGFAIGQNRRRYFSCSAEREFISPSRRNKTAFPDPECRACRSQSRDAPRPVCLCVPAD